MPEQEKYTPSESKQEIWDRIAIEVEQITDALGHGVDDGIKETIIAFKAYEFSTSGSCEGHVEGEHGLPYPWIDIETEEPDGWKDDEKKQKEWRIKNLTQRKKMIDLLAEFYASRNSPIEARLTFENHGIFGAFRILSMGAETMDLLSKEEQIKQSLNYQKEMRDFTDFLKNKYFS